MIGFFMAAVLCTGTHQEISESIGNMIGKDLQGISIDYEAFVRGLKKGSEGKDSPLNLEECFAALGAIQAEANLKEAKECLARVSQESGICSLEKGKLLFRVEKEGKGDRVESYHAPLVRFEGKTLHEQIFASSEEVIAFDQVIEGLSKGIQGMREGEKRTLYIHPDLGFGADDFSMPNTLLIFEVEVVKLDFSGEVISSCLAEEREGC